MKRKLLLLFEGSVVMAGLLLALAGWLQREGAWIRPTARGFDFLSDLQQLFLPEG